MYSKGFNVCTFSPNSSSTVARIVLDSIGGRRLKCSIGVQGIASINSKGSDTANRLAWMLDTYKSMMPIGEEDTKVLNGIASSPEFQHNTIMEYYIFYNSENSESYKGYVVVLNSRTDEYLMYFIYSYDKENPTSCKFELMDFDCLIEQLNTFEED